VSLIPEGLFPVAKFIGKKFRQRSMQITAKRRIQRILKNVRKLSGNFGESRDP